MSLMDKIKEMFSGGSSASEHDHSHAGHDHSHDHSDAAHSHDDVPAMEDVPPAPAAPLDPLGTAMPQAGGAIPTPQPPTGLSDDESADKSA